MQSLISPSRNIKLFFLVVTDSVDTYLFTIGVATPQLPVFYLIPKGGREREVKEAKSYKTQNSGPPDLNHRTALFFYTNFHAKRMKVNHCQCQIFDSFHA